MNRFGVYNTYLFYHSFIMLKRKKKWKRSNSKIYLFVARLPKWFGERPGKKSGDPETPEGLCNICYL